jgi:hypothetical protein
MRPPFLLIKIKVFTKGWNHDSFYFARTFLHKITDLIDYTPVKSTFILNFELYGHSLHWGLSLDFVMTFSFLIDSRYEVSERHDSFKLIENNNINKSRSEIRVPKAKRFYKVKH